MFRHKLSSVFSLLALFMWVTHASAIISIEVTKGVESAIPIAVVPFGDGQTALPIDVAQVIRDDLERSGRFAAMAVADLPTQPHDFAGVQFPDWRRLGMDNLVIGRMRPTQLGEYEIEFRLVDVFNAKQVTGFKIMTKEKDLRLAGHQIADIVYEKLTGVAGAFATRICYITVQKGAGGQRTFSLQVADSDGYGPKTLLQSDQPLLSPAWSPDGASIAYVSFEDAASAIYIQNLATGNRQKIASEPGINSAPAWSPDGTQLALTLSRDGNPEIYILNLGTRQFRRMTNGTAIDTEASWSPDGRKLAFTSDRGGSPQIYEIDIGSGQLRRITFDMGQYNARARYSPDGHKLALVHQQEGQFRIGVVDLESMTLSVLTHAHLDESPSFAPNGQMIIYATVNGGETELAAVSVDGSVQQRLALQRGGVREPIWGPIQK